MPGAGLARPRQQFAGLEMLLLAEVSDALEFRRRQHRIHLVTAGFLHRRRNGIGHAGTPQSGPLQPKATRARFVDTPLAQSVRRHQRPLAAATGQHDPASRRAEFVDRIDDQPPGAGKRRDRRFVEAAQVDDDVVGPHRVEGNERHLPFGFRTAFEAEAAERRTPWHRRLRRGPVHVGSRPSRRCSVRCACRPPSTATAVPMTPTVAQVPPSTETSGKTAR